jgi:hypothetical protein
MAKYIRCIQPTGSVVLFDGLVTMEYLNEIQVSDAAFLRVDIQNAITAGALVEIPSLGYAGTAALVLMGSWDASVETNYPPAVFGHCYRISGAGQLTNGPQTGDYVIDDHIFYSMAGEWEKMIEGATYNAYTGGVWIVGAAPGSVNDVYSKVTDPDGTVSSFTSGGATVTLTLQATPNISGTIPSVTFDGNPVTMAVTQSGSFQGTVSFPMASGVFQADHEDGASDTITLSSSLVPAITAAVIQDYTSILVAPRTEFTTNDPVRVNVTTAAPVQRVEVRRAGSLKAAAAITVVGAGPYNINTLIDSGVGTAGGDVRVGIVVGSGVQWGPWTPTGNTVARSDVTPSMSNWLVTVQKIDPRLNQPYGYLSYNGLANVTVGSFTNTDWVTLAAGSNNTVGNFPTSGVPATFSAFQVKGIKLDSGTSTDKSGAGALVFTLTKYSNGRTATYSNVLVPYYSKHVQATLYVNEESLISSQAGYQNPVSLKLGNLSTNTAVPASEIILASLQVRIGTGATAGTWLGAWGVPISGVPSWALNRPTRTFVVTDTVLKGLYPYYIDAGETISGDAIPSSTGPVLLSGFEVRQYTLVKSGTIDARRVLDMGVNVLDPSLLSCTNYTFGASADNYTWSVNKMTGGATEIGKYTISNGNTPASPNTASVAGAGGQMLYGKYWWNNDYNNTSLSSSTVFDIEEAASSYPIMLSNIPPWDNF